MALLQSLARGLVLAVLMSIALGLLAEVSKWVPDLTLEAARRGGRSRVRLDEPATDPAQRETQQPSSAVTKGFC